MKVELQPVSPRLRTALIHPEKKDLTVDVQFSPDGKRIMARSYPSDVVHVWDVDSGKQVTALQINAGKWGQVLVSADWSTLYVSHANGTTSPVEREGKRLYRSEYDSDVQAWDLATAKRTGTFRFTPSRGIFHSRLSPDGGTIATFEYRSGEYEEGPPSTASLWDVKTKLFRPLPEGLDTPAEFSADGKTLLATLLDDKRQLVAWKLFDVATATEKQSLPAPREGVYAGAAALSPDGRLLATNLLTVKAREYLLKLWDTATAEELMTFKPDGTDRLSSLVFSPDGTQLVVSTFDSEPMKLFLFDLAKRTPSATVTLGPKAFSFGPTFSPDGRWIVIVTQVEPALRRDIIDPLETPQARIHVIDSASGAECETLIAPQGLMNKASFNPDGTLFATGTTGKVLLWDFRQPPAQAQRSRR